MIQSLFSLLTAARVVDCGSLDDPDFGAIITNGTRVGSVARYSCSSGYQLDGSSTRVCQADGEWSGEAPTCERMCTLAVHPSNSQVPPPSSNTLFKYYTIPVTRLPIVL